jgi:plasmid replication initiation protein
MSDQQLSFILTMDSPLIGKVKNDRSLMVWNFFALTKERVTELPPYQDGNVFIEVKATKSGVATIWDKEILIYVASLMMDKLNRGEVPSQRFTFTLHDFCRVTGARPGGAVYDRLKDGFERLQGTQIKTNIETGGEGEDNWFSWVKQAKINYRRNADGIKEMRSATVEICDWLYRAVLKDNRMLTYHHDYFRLGPLERRLYEIGRAHCGAQQGAFKINIEKLRVRVGSNAPLKLFKSKLVNIAKDEKALPEYGISIVDPRRPFGLTDPKAPPLTGRTPLKSWMVLFYRTDKLAKATPFSHAAELPDQEL